MDSIGKWEGDTLVIESTGFDDRSWLSENRVDRRYGYTHSDELKTIERYQRIHANTIDAWLTIIDPKTFTQPWVTTGQILRSPDTEIGEYFCVPSEARDIRTGCCYRQRAQSNVSLFSGIQED